MNALQGRPVRGTYREAQPPHPDRERWCVALFGCAVVVTGFWGAPAAWWVVAHHARAEQYVHTHIRVFHLIHVGFWYGAWCFIAIAGLGLVWAAFTVGRWFRRVRAVDGQYLSLVIPRPQGGGSVARSNPEAPYVLWDRLIATLHAARTKGLPPYLAAELWGDADGRVHWGVWLPHHVREQREAVRHLMIAERPQARMVDAPDPLNAALRVQNDDRDDDGERWYASGLLVLRARDYYPLPQDSLAQRSVVAALRPSRAILASGVSVIVTPAPLHWARRVDQLAQRWRWTSRYQRRFDERYKQEIDDISTKAQQAHAWTCVRVHVVARTREAARAECASVIGSLATSRRRYKHTTQRWHARLVRVCRVQDQCLPAAARCRAPFPPLPRLIAVFPFV
jgi:hypothetical protein